MKWLQRTLTLLTLLLFAFALATTAYADGVLSLPRSLQSIEEEAFSGDTSLNVVVVPESVGAIGDRAFANSSVSWINIPWDLNALGEDVFLNTPLQGVIVPEGSPAASLLEEKGYGDLLVYNNDLDVWPRTHSNWFYATYGESMEISVEFRAACEEGLRFSWYRVEWDENGQERRIELPSENGSNMTTDPITDKTEYCCQITDLFGNEHTTPFFVMVDNGLEIWAENNHNSVYADADGNVTLRVEAKADNESVMSFTWYQIVQIEEGLFNLEEIEGERGQSLSVSGVSGYQRYACFVTDCYGGTADCWFEVEVEPECDSVSSSSARDITATTAFVDLRYSVTEDTMNQGYRMGVVYAENLSDLEFNEETHRFEKAMLWTWGGESSVYGPANEADYAGWLDELIPGHTYYYFGVITREDDGTVVGYEQNTLRFFRTGDGNDLQTLDLERGGLAPRGDAKTAFRFVVPQDGVYALRADVEMNEMCVRRVDDSQMARDNNISEISFVGHEGETLYLFVRDFSEDANITVEFLGVLPDEDAVWTISVADIRATSVDVNIGYTVTEETAQHGYRVGFAFSQRRDDLLVPNERGDFNCSMWSWEELHDFAFNGAFDRLVDGLVPNRTYYYRAVLLVDNQVTAWGDVDDIGSFTTASIDTLPEIGETPWGTFDWTMIEQNDKVAFRFTPDRDGIYGLMADRQISEMGAILGDRDYVSMEYDTDLHFFVGHEGEPVVLFARNWNEDAGVLVRFFMPLPTEDSVSSTIADEETDIGSTWANILVTADVTEETADCGFRIGVAFSQNEEDLILDENEQRFHTDMWDWDYLDQAMNDGEFRRLVDQLIPSSTYYYRAFISVYDRVIACDEEIQCFTTKSADDVACLEVGDNYDLPKDELVPYRFTAEQSGVYRLVLSDPVDQIDVRRPDGSHLTSGNDERDEAFFFVAEGESVYLYLRTWEKDDVSFEICFYSGVPENDGISTGRMQFEDGYNAKLALSLSITPETAAKGYGYGVEYSPNESFVDERGDRYTSDFFWWYSEDVSVGLEEEVWLDNLLPGVTYYYRGFIDYCDGSERLVEDDVHSFTVDGSPEDIPELVLGAMHTFSSGESFFYRFTAPESGVYVLDGSAHFCAYNSDGMGMLGTDEEENNARSAVRALILHADETVFINIHVIDGYAWLRVSEGPGSLDALSLGEWSELRDNHVLCFTAPEEGWYSFTVDEPWRGDLHYYNSYVEGWSDSMGLGYNGDKISLYAVEGETLYFITWYDMDQGLMRMRVEQASSPEENAVFSMGEPEKGDTWATMDVNYSVTADTLMELFGQGYFVGVAYSQDEDFPDDATEMWTWDPIRVLADSAVITRTLDRLIPNTTYHYFAFLQNAETGEIFAREEAKSFTTDPAENIPELTLGEALPVPEGSSVFTFRAETDGVYALVTNGVSDLEVRNSRGNWIAGKYFELFEIGPETGIGFHAYTDEMFYIYLLNGDENAMISVVTGLEALPVLTVGELSEELWGRQVVCFTAPAEGWYRFESFSDWYHRLAIATPETGWVDPKFDERRVTRYLAEGETVYPGCWFDDDHARVQLLVTAIELPESLSVETLDMTDVTDVSAVFHMSFGMPILDPTQRYNYGIVIRPADDPDFLGGEAWGETDYDGSMIRHGMHDPCEAHEESFSDLPLCPDATYYYEAILFLYDEENDQWDTYYGGLKSFTTAPLNREVTAVNAGEQISLRWIEDGDYQLLSFTVPENPGLLYTAAVSDASIWVIGPDQRVSWPMDFGGERICFMPGVGHEGETYTIYLRVWNRDGLSFEIEQQYPVAAQIGVNSALSDNCLYSVTAPVSGDYLLTVDGERSLTVINPSSGRVFDSWYWVFLNQVEEGDTILFFSHPKEGWTEADGNLADVTILPSEFSVETEQELRGAVDKLTMVANNDPFFSFFDINVNAPITLTADLHCPTLVMLNLNDTLTVPEGVSLTTEGDLFVNEGGSLVVQEGGAFALRCIYEGWVATIQMDGGTVVMNGDFSSDTNAFIRLNPKYYDDLDAMLAAAGNLPNELFALELEVNSDEMLASAAAMNPSSFYSFTLSLVYGYTPAFADLAPFNNGNTTIIANEGTNLVFPVGEEQSLNAYLRINRGTLTVNGTLSVEDGGAILLMGGGSVVNNGNLAINENSYFLWYGETYVENNGTLTVGAGSHFAISARNGAPQTCEVVNNGTVYLSGDVQDGISFTGDGIVERVIMF